MVHPDKTFLSWISGSGGAGWSADMTLRQYRNDHFFAGLERNRRDSGFTA
ncbi:hypothetical protein LWC05_11915 [Acetobacter sicerae]|uniref:Uncharacterized protein n=1 Tax=Acetobacter sicerae TaxID=85325 RepID=A0ABS8VWZ0_9PROT|nr:hypothetical protein [Acetobacter sicerae]MCE0744588.1 hypothetical protein [Acetobacter sicerae]